MLLGSSVRRTNRRDIGVKALKIIVAILVTLFASWVGLMVGDSLLAGTRGLSIIFAICSMGAFVIAFCSKDK